MVHAVFSAEFSWAACMCNSSRGGPESFIVVQPGKSSSERTIKFQCLLHQFEHDAASAGRAWDKCHSGRRRRELAKGEAGHHAPTQPTAAFHTHELTRTTHHQHHTSAEKMHRGGQGVCQMCAVDVRPPVPLLAWQPAQAEGAHDSRSS
eukprot:scaffold295860_cov13-Tisochrysis_lutea.AAC.1